MSAGALARNLNVPRTRIERLATEQIAVTPDTALRLAKFFRTTPEFWMNTQSSYDLKTEAVAIQDQLLAIHELKAACFTIHLMQIRRLFSRKSQCFTLTTKPPGMIRERFFW
jgi:addiction module HigA family antidote